MSVFTFSIILLLVVIVIICFLFFFFDEKFFVKGIFACLFSLYAILIFALAIPIDKTTYQIEETYDITEYTLGEQTKYSTPHYIVAYKDGETIKLNTIGKDSIITQTEKPTYLSYGKVYCKGLSFLYVKGYVLHINLTKTN